MKQNIICIMICVLLGASAPAQESYRERQAYKLERQKEGEKYGYGAIAMFVACFAIGIWLKERQLKRTNKYGTQEFDSTTDFFAKSIFEGLANAISVILFAGGLILVFVALERCA